MYPFHLLLYQKASFPILLFPKNMIQHFEKHLTALKNHMHLHELEKIGKYIKIRYSETSPNQMATVMLSLFIILQSLHVHFYTVEKNIQMVTFFKMTYFIACYAS